MFAGSITFTVILFVPLHYHAALKCFIFERILVMMLNIYLGCTDTSFEVSYSCRTCVIKISCYNFFLNCLCRLIIPVLVPVSFHPRYLYSVRELTHPCRIDLFWVKIFKNLDLLNLKPMGHTIQPFEVNSLLH